MVEPREAVVHAISEHLKVLSNESRLLLLSMLREPRRIDEISLPPSRSAGSAGAVVSRQAVQRHLDALLDAGLVRRQADADRPGYAYVLDYTRVFATMEEIRVLTRFESELDPTLHGTLVDNPSAPRCWEEGPKLVLVHGVREGHAFMLRDADAPAGEWIVGRASSSQVAISYDPYVSAEQAAIKRVGGGYRLLDLHSARNVTTINWAPLEPGGHAALAPGDVVGVGRSLLVFRDR